ncbi:MAG: T9SS type A sorting domain-containing protein [Flavobacteriales bacterium]
MRNVIPTLRRSCRTVVTAALIGTAALWSSQALAQGSNSCATAQVAVTGAQTYGPMTAGAYVVNDCTGDGVTRAKWYQWTAPSNGTLDVRSCQSNRDTYMAMYSGSCGAPTLLICNDDNGDFGCHPNGYNSGWNGAVTSGTTYYVEWLWYYTGSDLATNWVLTFTPTGCTPPTATTPTVVDNCGGGNYTIQVNITSVGSITPITINNGGGALATVPAGPITTPGVYTVGPFSSATTQALSLVNGTCNTSLGSFSSCCGSACAVAVAVTPGAYVGLIKPSCAVGGGTCINASARATWYSFTPGADGQVTITSCQAGVDTYLALYSSVGGSCASLVCLAANDDDFSPCHALGYNSTIVANLTGGETYFIEWNGNYPTGNNANFNWTLNYISCTPPVASASLASQDCGLGTFMVSVNVTNLGSSAPLEIVSNVNGVEANNINALGVVSLPAVYTAGTPVSFTIRGMADNTCVSDAGTVADCCNGTCAGASAAILGSNFNGDMTCGAGASGAVITVTPTNARWWTWTPASNGLAVASSCDNGTSDDTHVTVHTGSCGGLTVVGSNDDAGCGPLGYQSSFGWLVNGGTQYYIEWDDRWQSTGHTWDLSLVPCATPAHDVCSAEIPGNQPLAPGGSFTLTGDGTCADDDIGIAGIFGAGTTGYVWATFQLTSCADVVIDYCGSPTFTNGSLNMYTDCSGVGPVNSQSFDFGCFDGNPRIFYNSLPAGVYYYPILTGNAWAGNVYNVTVTASTAVIPCQPNTCSDALPLSCGGTVSGTTVSNSNTQGPSVCLPNHVGPGPNGWYYIDAVSTEDITASTCVGTTYNSMITVYDAGVSPGNCNALVCLTGNDDNCGAGTNTPSEVNWPAVAGHRYYVVVHGPGGFVNSTGTFSLNITCAAPTCPAVANDVCGTPELLTPVLAGTGVVATKTNCGAYADANPSCDVDLSFVPAAGRAQGVWYTFNSLNNTYMNLYLADQDLNGAYSATALSYVLYSGTCGALTEVACVQAGEGTTAFPLLTINTPYLLMVHNQGGVGTEGTFGMVMEFPAQNDAEVTSIDTPVGNLCTTTVSPLVTITNNGQQDLASVTVTYTVVGGSPVVTVINFGTPLTFGQSEQVALTPSVTTPGPHTINVVATLPNGVADEIPADNTASGPFAVDGEEVQLVFIQDNWGSETTWDIYDALEIAPIASGGPYTDFNPGFANVETRCLPLTFGGCFTLRIEDLFGDGMCCDQGLGSWEIRSPSGALLLGDAFHGLGVLAGSTPNGGTDSPNTTNNPTYTGHEFCLPKGPADMESTECGIFNNVLNNKVYALQAPGTGPYQFEFSDPDQAFRRRISVNQRYVKFSQMQSSPLVAGTHYFGRARRDAANDGYFNDNWGSGCEMGLDPAVIPGCGQLINDVGSPTHSCGVDKTFGYSDKIWAKPVLGATQYRFKFEGLIDPDGPSNPAAPVGGARIITQASYVRVLNWFTYTLVVGQTYTVTVEVFVNGSWSGFCGPACAVTIVAPFSGGGGTNAVAATAGQDVQLYPNPVRDGNVNLVINGLSGSENTVAVDIYDVFGKRVFTRSIGTEGATEVSTVLNLGTSLASGVYMVDITMGDRHSTQRLSIQ